MKEKKQNRARQHDNLNVMFNMASAIIERKEK